MKADLLDIAEVARQSRLPASTLRFYEEKGLIRSAGRHGLRRVFERNVLDQLAFITLGRLAGFTLRDLSAMVMPHRGFVVDRGKVSARADEVDRKIEELAALRDCLRHVAKCPQDDPFTCSRFRRLLRRAKWQRPDG